MAVLVDLEQVAVRRVDRVLFAGLSLTVSDGDRIGLVGANGTGKSTLLRLVAGVDQPEEGAVRRGRGARVGFLEQVPRLPAGTVGSAVGEGWEAAAALDRLGMAPSVDVSVTDLSGGQAKRVALARVLARPAELLVLDEPTNHLDLGAVAWLERRLATFRGGLVLVSHDRHLLDRLTTRMVELDRGRAFVHDTGYAGYLQSKAQREEQAASSEASRRNLARRELAWLQRGAQARSRKPQARVDAARRLLATEGPAPERPGELELGVGAPRLGDQVIEVVDAGYRYDDGPQVLAGASLVLGRRDRVGIVGANGTGKSTLLDLLAGRRRPTVGTVVRGPTVVVGYYDQQGVVLDQDARVQDVVSGPHRTAGSLADQALMQRFWFTGELPFARVGSLSGGERRRLQLLVVLATQPNVLLLDEPTNDLDLDTLRILEDFLDGWPGAVVVASHDRTFLELTTDRLVAVEPDGSLAGVPGGVAGWVAKVEEEDRRRPTAGSAPVAGTASPKAARAGAGPTTRRLLRETEKEMATLQRGVDRLVVALEAADDHDALARVGGQLAEAQAQLSAAEDRWLQLAESGPPVNP